MTSDNEKRDEVLKRLLKTPPQPRGLTGKGGKEKEGDQKPTDTSEAKKDP